MRRPTYLITVSPSGFAIYKSGSVKKDMLPVNQCLQLTLRKKTSNSYYLLPKHIYKCEIRLHPGRRAGRKLGVSAAPGIFPADTEAGSSGSFSPPWAASKHPSHVQGLSHFAKLLSSWRKQIKVCYGQVTMLSSDSFSSWTGRWVSCL